MSHKKKRSGRLKSRNKQSAKAANESTNSNNVISVSTRAVDHSTALRAAPSSSVATSNNGSSISFGGGGISSRSYVSMTSSEITMQQQAIIAGEAGNGTKAQKDFLDQQKEIERQAKSAFIAECASMENGGGKMSPSSTINVSTTSAYSSVFVSYMTQLSQYSCFSLIE